MFSGQNDLKDCLLHRSILPAQPSWLKKLLVAEEIGTQKEAKVADNSSIQTDCRDDRRSESDEYVIINSKDANVEAESHVAAAWNAPQMESWKLLFDMDYSPPKTHPPVHN